MSGVLKLRAGNLLSDAGRAGPRRLAMIALGGAAIATLVVAVVLSGDQAPLASQDARMKTVDPLPGGLHSTPEMNALGFEANTHGAQAALKRGESYTPPLAPSVPVFPAPPRPDLAAPAPVPVPVVQPVRPPHAVAPLRVVLPEEVEPPAPAVRASPTAHVIPVQAIVDPKAVEAYNNKIGDLFNQWGGRYPKTDVVLPPAEPATDPGPPRSRNTGAPATATSSTPVTTPVCWSLRDAVCSRIRSWH
jgi:intracellular multiplication protein IcmE